MIKGIGTDIVEIQRIADAIDKFGERFAQKVLSECEKTRYDMSLLKAQFLAGRFAAKEAFAKAIGTGMRDGLFFPDIVVTNADNGKPAFELTGQALKLMNEQGITNVHLTISHEKSYAIAYVICEA